MACWFTAFFALFPFLVYTAFSNHISTTLSPLFSSTQIKFWSENVQNNMPLPILKKLSPLTQKDCDFYASMISNDVGIFSADANFCSLAKLSCTFALEDVTSVGSLARFFWADAATKVYESADDDDHHQKNEEYDPFSFFRILTLKNGNSVRLPANLQKSLPDRAFLPPQIASKISLNIKEISRFFPGSTTEPLKILFSTATQPP
ncbi:BURP domain-containing protein 16-like [Henckelia pumila]|uniref:BURP domain-containing protein 16-like n=1 Tax=Henckelia pumila TaxID=405737 RepID=UPI003C6E98A8